MRSDQNKTGLTLVEMLIVVAIVVILTTMVIGLAGRIDNQSKEQLTKNTIGIITAALRQFNDYEYRYPHPNYFDLKFPLDCNSIPDPEFINALGATALPTGGYSRSDVWCFFLSRVSSSRKTLDKIDESLKQRSDIIIDGKAYSLLRILDPWGTPLQYRYYYNYLIPKDKWTFPVIISAGPDKKFGNTDDISSRK
jgi:prepilin-type N-terminal cleavage/methylation domain-containing protein